MSNTASQVLPSGGDFATAPVPTLPDAPDRLLGAIGGYVSLAGIAWCYRAVRKRDGMGGGDPKFEPQTFANALNTYNVGRYAIMKDVDANELKHLRAAVLELVRPAA